MNRVMVMGVSPGSGKSTFARRFSMVIGIPVTHLDTLFWNPGWVQSTPELFLCRQQEVVSRDRWIIEGNYTTTGYGLRTDRADTLIYLDMPLLLCVFRVFRRRYEFREGSRMDMAPGCPEKIDWAFLRFILTTYHRRRRNIAHRLRSFESLGDGRRAIVLKGSREIEAFLRATSERIAQPYATTD